MVGLLIILVLWSVYCGYCCILMRLIAESNKVLMHCITIVYLYSVMHLIASTIIYLVLYNNAFIALWCMQLLSLILCDALEGLLIKKRWCTVGLLDLWCLTPFSTIIQLYPGFMNETRLPIEHQHKPDVSATINANKRRNLKMRYTNTHFRRQINYN